MKLGSQGLDLIKAFESFVGYVYDDARAMVKGKYREWKGEPVQGTLTIGYGHTNAAGLPKITKGMKITKEAASLLLDADLDAVEADVRRLVHVSLKQHEFDALVSFHFNCHGLTLRDGKPSTCCRLLNQGEPAFRQAMDSLVTWTKPEWARKGLIQRRRAERLLFEGRFEELQTIIDSKTAA